MVADILVHSLAAAVFGGGMVAAAGAVLAEQGRLRAARWCGEAAAACLLVALAAMVALLLIGAR